jgi:hypothetical protein
MTGATSGAETAYPSEEHEFSSIVSGDHVIVEQKLFILPKNMSSPPLLVGIMLLWSRNCLSPEEHEFSSIVSGDHVIVEQKLLILPKNTSSPPLLVGIMLFNL